MFWKLDALDPFGANPWKRSVEAHMNTTFGGDINMFARVVEYLATGIDLVHEDRVDDEAESQTQSLKSHFSTAELEAADFFEWPNLLPDG